MRTTRSVAVAMWMLEHLACGPYTEAISGDLLEGLRQGNSVGWYCRQALWAIAVGLGAKARELAEPLLFAVFWSGLYPAWWLLMVKGPLTQVALARWAALDVPYATSLNVVAQIIPVAAFLWVGLAVYLLCHKDLARAVSRWSLFRGLSIGLNLLLVLLSLQLSRANRPVIGFSHAVHDEFSGTHVLGVSLLLSVSLFAAILSVLPPRQACKSSLAKD
jgi:hypothetical protein